MEEQLYRISDVATILNIKSHVIRNWEGELDIAVPRSDSGHRIYTQETLDLLTSVKMLKDKGFSLKQIRLLLPNINSLKNADDKTLELLKIRLNSCTISENLEKTQTSHITSPAPLHNLHTSTDNSVNIQDFRDTMKDIITDALSENIDAISKEIGHNVSDLVTKEMNYQLIQHENIINERIKAMEIILKNNSHSRKKNNYFGLRSKFANLVSSDCHFN